AAGIFTVYSYTQYASNRERIDIWDARKGGAERPSQYDSTHDAMESWETLTWTAGIISVASLASAAIWWWGFRDDATSTSAENAEDPGISIDSLALTPGATPARPADFGAWSFSLSGRF